MTLAARHRVVIWGSSNIRPLIAAALCRETTRTGQKSKKKKKKNSIHPFIIFLRIHGKSEIMFSSNNHHNNNVVFLL